MAGVPERCTAVQPAYCAGTEGGVGLGVPYKSWRRQTIPELSKYFLSLERQGICTLDRELRYATFKIAADSGAIRALDNQRSSQT